MSSEYRNLPQGWVLTTVDQVGAVQLGLKKSPDKNTGRGRTKYLRAANVTPTGLDLRDVLEMDFTATERALYTLRPGDVLLTEASGSAAQVGRAAIWCGEIPGCCYQMTLLRFRGHATIPEYAVLVFRDMALTGVIARAARGVGIQHLSAQRFACLAFPLPPLAEQHRIVEAADRRLSELRAAGASLRTALARTLEQDREIISAAVAGALVPTDASLAAAAGRPYEPARLILDRLTVTSEEQASFLGAAPDHGVRDPGAEAELPDGWAWARVRDVGESRVGQQLSPDRRRGSHPLPYLRVANVFEDHIDVRDVNAMDFTPEEFSKYRLEPGDVLLNEGQSLELVGRPAVFRGELPDVAFQNTLIRFRPAPGVDPEYALLVFRHYLHNGQFQRIARRSTNIAHLGLGRFIELPFPLPPSAEQQRVVSAARRRLAQSAAQAAAIRAALTRTVEMEREIIAAAVAGRLVSQDPSDEPAALLLERLGPPSTARDQSSAGEGVGDADNFTENSTPETMANTPHGRTERTGTSRGALGRTVVPLGDALRDVRAPVPLPELFALAGYDRDSTEQIEQFYLALREALGTTLCVVGGDTENPRVEALRAP